MAQLSSGVSGIYNLWDHTGLYSSTQDTGGS